MSDWDAELKKIDKQLESMSDAALIPAPAEGRARRRRRHEVAAERADDAHVGRVPATRARDGARRRHPVLAVLASLRDLGSPAISPPSGDRRGGGLWSSVWTWRHRTARAHVLSLLLVVWGLVLGAIELLPRVGYAKPDPARPAGWTCAAPAPCDAAGRAGAARAGAAAPAPRRAEAARRLAARVGLPGAGVDSANDQDLPELHRRRVGARRRAASYFENRNPADTRRSDRHASRSRTPPTSTARSRRRQRGFELWRRTPAPARGDVLRRVGDLMVAAQGGDRGPDDARDGQAAHRDARRRAGRDRHRVLRGDEGRRLFGHTVPSELREQVGDELPPADRRGGHHHAVQLPARDPDVEDVSRARLRKRVRLQAGRGRAAHRTRARRDHARGRAAARGDPARARPRRGRRRGDRGASRTCRSISFTGSTETGQLRRRDVRPHAQAAVARDGRQERADRAWTTPTSTSRSRACSGARSARPGSAAPRRAASILQNGIHDEFLEPARRSRTGAEARRRAQEGHGRRPAHQRELAREGRALRRHRAGGGRRPASAAGGAPTGKGLEHGFFFEPTIFARVERGMRIEQEEIFGPVL